MVYIGGAIMNSIKAIVAVEKKVWKTSPISAAITILTGTIAGLIPAVLSSTTAEIVDFVSKGNASVSNVMPPMILLVGMYILNSILQSAYSVANNAGVFEKVNLALRADLCVKKAGVALIKFEMPAFLDRLEEADEIIENEEFPMAHYSFVNQVQAIVEIVSLALLLYRYHPYLCLLSCVSVLPIWINRWVRGNAFYRVKSKTAPAWRKAKKIQSWFVSEPHAKELRINDSYNAMLERYNEKFDERVSVERGFYLNDYAKFAGCSLLKRVGLVASLVLSLKLAINGKIEYGALAAALLAFTSLQDSMTEFFKTIGQIRYYVKRVLKLLAVYDEMEEDKKNNSITQGEKFELSDIRFTYPECDEETLKGITLKINKGERIAIVGANGAGKTTLSKILLGQFKPDKGQVIYGIKEGERVAYVPQELPKLPVTVREYLVMGNDMEPGDDEICSVLRELGLDSSLDFLSNMLGRAFGGRELSGGQWQRLAIAKALLNKPAWYIFDEATRAIDPMQESAVFDSILAATTGKNAFIVTHRLALCPHVEKVLLMENGKVVAFDTHDNLMNESEDYAAMYRTQQAGYV